ncbi:hypothetical protein BRPE64_ACDS18550 [Caballeronia insecticola]|uniref:Uncharacterized protein n=1 Tax=Caballeronia insecticola TaxID=758793 RepID=R4WHL4_9BURK|nr:hypothetical protein BRPE64_ACDS18550 [Caballeronia insecticola]
MSEDFASLKKRSFRQISKEAAYIHDDTAKIYAAWRST